MNKNLANFLRETRKKAKLSQRGLASKCGTSQQYISLLERVKIEKPLPTMLISLENVLNLEANTLTSIAGYTLNTQQSLATIVKTARVNALLFQEIAAELCGISRIELSYIECGKVTKPTKRTLKALTAIPNLELTTLFEICGYPLENV